MLVAFPVTLEDGTVIYGNEEPFEFEEGRRLNGVDADGNRITNIVGFDKPELLKWCPHCEEILVASDFGPEGRPIPDSQRRRDQSWCLRCRSMK